MNKITHIRQKDRGVDDELGRIVSTLNNLIDKIAEPSTSYPKDTGKAALEVVSTGNNEYSLAVRTKDGIVSSAPGVFGKSDFLSPAWNATQRSYNKLLAKVVELADEKPQTFYQDDEPTTMHTGDFWFDTSEADNYIMYRWDGSEWQQVGVAQTSLGLYAGQITAGNITAGTISISKFTNDSGYITSASAGNKTTYSATAPATPNDGDIWFDTSTENEYVMKRWDGSSWVITSVYMDDSGIYTGDLTAGQITTGTLTGITIQTATNGQRVVIDGSENKITFYSPTVVGPAGSVSASENEEAETTLGVYGNDNLYLQASGILVLNSGASDIRVTGNTSFNNNIEITGTINTYTLAEACAKSVGTGATQVAAGNHNHSGVYAPVASGYYLDIQTAAEAGNKKFINGLLHFYNPSIPEWQVYSD